VRYDNHDVVIRIKVLELVQGILGHVDIAGMPTTDTGEGFRLRATCVDVLQETRTWTDVSTNIESRMLSEGRGIQFFWQGDEMIRSPLRCVVSDVAAHEDEPRRIHTCSRECGNVVDRMLLE
jgi:hypothetical protein